MKSNAAQDLLALIDNQLMDAADHLQDAVTNEAQTTARGYIDLVLKDAKGRDLETRPNLIEPSDITDLQGYLALQSKAEELGLNIRLNEDLNHTQVELENDDLAYRQWRIRVDGWS